MIETVARFVTRAGGKDTEKVDLIIGKAFKGESVLKKNTVYEIVNVMGELMLKEVGPSAIGDNKKDSLLCCNWGHDVNQIVIDKLFILTEDEHDEIPI